MSIPQITAAEVEESKKKYWIHLKSHGLTKRDEYGPHVLVMSFLYSPASEYMVHVSHKTIYRGYDVNEAIKAWSDPDAYEQNKDVLAETQASTDS